VPQACQNAQPGKKALANREKKVAAMPSPARAAFLDKLAARDEKAKASSAAATSARRPLKQLQPAAAGHGMVAGIPPAPRAGSGGRGSRGGGGRGSGGRGSGTATAARAGGRGAEGPRLLPGPGASRVRTAEENAGRCPATLARNQMMQRRAGGSLTPACEDAATKLTNVCVTIGQAPNLGTGRIPPSIYIDDDGIIIPEVLGGQSNTRHGRRCAPGSAPPLPPRPGQHGRYSAAAARAGWAMRRQLLRYNTPPPPPAAAATQPWSARRSSSTTSSRARSPRTGTASCWRRSSPGTPSRSGRA
jgi:hypothetical protein